MKRLVSLILVIVLAFCVAGCEKKAQQISQETLFFENTTWGMTKAETLKALKLKDTDVEKISDGVRDYVDTYSVKDYKYNNLNCDLLIGFSNGKLPELKQDMLVSVRVSTSNKSLLASEQKKFSKQLADMQSGSTGEPIAGINVTWEATKTMKDYLIDNNIQIKTALESLNVDMSKFEGLTDEEILDKMDGQFSKLATLSVMQLNEKDENGYVGYIDFNGERYAGVSAIKE